MPYTSTRAMISPPILVALSISVADSDGRMPNVSLPYNTHATPIHSSHLFLLCSITVGAIDTVVQSTCVAEVLALRVSSPKGRGCGTTVGTLATQIANLVRSRG